MQTLFLTGVFLLTQFSLSATEGYAPGTCRIFSDPFVNDFNGRRQTTPNRPQTLTLSEYTNRWKVEGVVSYSNQHHANILQDVVITLFDIDDNTIISIDSKKNVKISAKGDAQNVVTVPYVHVSRKGMGFRIFVGDPGVNEDIGIFVLLDNEVSIVWYNSLSNSDYSAVRINVSSKYMGRDLKGVCGIYNAITEGVGVRSEL
ncbi:uncharacterized protein [Oscarella lobularis]|uniref:uncharacterized protein n=1 Tax=Oscarella lobularis TaxID=121494 RepID=UPI00331326B3